MLKDPQTNRYAVRRAHRTYTPQFKAELVAACRQPGASIAALALQHGMNANVLHRWLKEWQRGLHRLDVDSGSTSPALAPQAPAFIPLALNTPPSTAASDRPPPPVAPSTSTSTPTSAPSIRIECHRPGLSVSVHWPVSDAAGCAQVLKALLP